MAHEGASANDLAGRCTSIDFHHVTARSGLIAALTFAMRLRSARFLASVLALTIALTITRLTVTVLAVADLTFASLTIALAALTAAIAAAATTTAGTALALRCAVGARLVLAVFTTRTRLSLALIATFIVTARLVLATRLRRTARLGACAAAAALLVFIRIGRKLGQRCIIAAISTRDLLARGALDIPQQ